MKKQEKINQAIIDGMIEGIKQITADNLSSNIYFRAGKDFEKNKILKMIDKRIEHYKWKGLDTTKEQVALERLKQLIKEEK